MPMLTYANIINARRPGLRGLGATTDTMYTYKSKSGAIIRGSEDQIAAYIAQSPDLTWEYVSKGTGNVPARVQVTGTPLTAAQQAPKPAAPAADTGPSAWSKILGWGKANQDTLVGMVKKPPKPKTPTGYVAPKSGMSNMLIIGGVAVVGLVGILMFMKR